ncbi:MAG: HAMP domain-containing protein [Gemmatimonadaceae bacterium]|nr:HAMP domain-containing protein [Gemmatimonadaceae bacterium]
MRWRPATLRGRLTLWYTIVIGVPFLVFELVGYLLFASALRGGTERFVDDALAAFTRELQAERFVRGDALETIRSTVREVHFKDLRIEVRDAAGALVAASEDAPPGPGAREGTRTVTLAGATFQVRGLYPRAEEEAVLVRIRGAFLLAVPVLLGLAATGGLLIARRGLRPVAAMGARAAEISASTLHERLPVGGGAELQGLATVVNALLDRLQASFERQRRFMADASHELRTPTAIVRAEAEVTLARPHRDEAEYRAALQVMHDASLRLTRIVEDLFLLVRADAGQLPMRRGPLYLEESVHDAALGVRHLAARRGVTVAVTSLVQAPLTGDGDLLGRVLLNLLDNAIKYAPAGSTVEVAMAAAPGPRCVVSVTDHGPGVPVEAQGRIFDRFVRAEASRGASAGDGPGGAGLGLAIARRIAELHGGTLELARSEPGHTEFRLVLPVDETTDG